MINFVINRIKLFSYPRKEFYSFLSKFLGFRPGNIYLYERAFIHKSASRTDSRGNIVNNERLEYLGDAILGAVIADYLFNRFPQRDEGFLTQMRSKLVNRNFLTQLTQQTGLHKFIDAKTNSPNTSSNIYGNAFEALIGAIYLDKGYTATHRFISKKIIKQYIDLEHIENLNTNYKSQLIEWAQKNRYTVNFLTREAENSKHLQFISQVFIDNKTVGEGVGNSKKESQQDAAKCALKKVVKS